MQPFSYALEDLSISGNYNSLRNMITIYGTCEEVNTRRQTRQFESQVVTRVEFDYLHDLA